MPIERHFNVTIYVADLDTKKLLMINHKKLKMWVPPGGHIEPNEIPDEAAKREVKEETGLEVELRGEKFPDQNGLIRPYGIQLNIIEKDKHEHLDIIYFALIPAFNVELVQNTVETDGIGWFTIDEIESESFNSFSSTKEWCRFFFNLIKTI